MIRTLTAILVAVPCFGLFHQARPGNTTVAAPASVFSRILTEVKKSGVPVLLPDELPYYVDSRQIRDVGVDAGEDGYTVLLHYRFDCEPSCFVGSFSAKRKPREGSGTGRRVELANGVVGYYIGSQCGADCPPAEIDWTLRGVGYAIRFVPDESSQRDTETALIKLANSSIAAGPR